MWVKYFPSFSASAYLWAFQYINYFIILLYSIYISSIFTYIKKQTNNPLKLKQHENFKTKNRKSKNDTYFFYYSLYSSRMFNHFNGLFRTSLVLRLYQ